jgi:co-chaperonin GroES (HSP10)
VDLVIFSKYAGTEVLIPAKDINGKDRQLQIINDEDILAVIRNENTG